MKKIFQAVLVMLCIFVLAAPAMAGKQKPPKSFCFASGLTAWCMMTSKGGKTKFSGGEQKVASYDIQGLVILPDTPYPIPCSGAGYMNGSMFVFSCSGTYPLEDEVATINTMGVWSIGSESLEFSSKIKSSSLVDMQGVGTANITDCENWPFAPVD